MRLVFLTATLLAGYFFIFGMFPVDSEATFNAPAGISYATDAGNAAPAAPMVNRNSEGGKLFMENCARCHSTNLTKDLTGPALWGVGERVDREILAAWIKNSGKVLESGDKYFNDLYKEWNKASMDPMPHLKPEQIEAIIDELTEAS